MTIKTLGQISMSMLAPRGYKSRKQYPASLP